MEEYFARQRRRRLIVLAAVLAAALVIFLVVMFAKFRAHSNYRFQSISDFFYQTIIGSEKLEYEFVDQNVSETQIGPYTITGAAAECRADSRRIVGLRDILSFSKSSCSYPYWRQTDALWE